MLLKARKRDPKRGKIGGKGIQKTIGVKRDKPIQNGHGKIKFARGLSRALK